MLALVIGIGIVGIWMYAGYQQGKKQSRVDAGQPRRSGPTGSTASTDRGNY
jgi:hypothetical protein